MSINNYLIIMIISSIILYLSDYQENYYTFFLPFLNKKEIKFPIINKNEYIYQNIDITTSTFYYKFIRNLSKFIIMSSPFLRISTTIEDNIMDLFNNSNLMTVSFPLIFDPRVNISKKQFVCNFNTTTLMLIANKKNVGFINNFNELDNNSIIGTTKENTSVYLLMEYIINKVLPNKNISLSGNSIENNVNKLLAGSIDVLAIVDNNPSNILKYILNNDYNKKLKLLELSFTDLIYNNGNFIYHQDFINLTGLPYHNEGNSIETIYFYDTILCNDDININIIYFLCKFLFKNRKNKNIYKNNRITNSEFSLSPNIILTNYGAYKYFKSINLINTLGDKKCIDIIGLKECNKKNISNIKSV